MSSSPEKPLILYTGRSPNGFKTTILVEELKAAYGAAGPDVEIFPIDISTNIQKEPWFIDINPNGRMPALVDRSRGGFKVFESAAILLYLAHHFDKEKKFTFDVEKEADDWSEMVQWVFWAHGGVGPMMGQAAHFKFTSEKIPYAIKRYQDETQRLFHVLEIRLKDREYLAGPGKGKYSIADLNVWPWIRAHAFIGVELDDDLPGLKAWIERIAARPAVQAGINSPPDGWQNAKK
ncbi:unnamed protein product [Peniophora sp. CBMAI 1063]|nr:unnamed protein product [Peniophora sp. CBMAI 1063]